MRSIIVSIMILCVIILSGCASAPAVYEAAPTVEHDFALNEEGGTTAPRPERKLIHTYYMSMEVSDIEKAISEITIMTTNSGGFVENTERGSSYDKWDKDSYASLTIRVPTTKIDTHINFLEEIGDITHEDISTQDVTDNYIDTKVWLDNKIKLRDRLKELLDKATDVEDILAIEKELTRIQSEIDSMQGRLDALEKNIAYTKVRITLKRKRILGPLGYFFKGLWWGVEKLFVIQ